MTGLRGQPGLVGHPGKRRVLIELVASANMFVGLPGLSGAPGLLGMKGQGGQSGTCTQVE